MTGGLSSRIVARTIDSPGTGEWRVVQEESGADRGSQSAPFICLQPVNEDVEAEPDNINEMPIPGRGFEGEMVLR